MPHLSQVPKLITVPFLIEPLNADILAPLAVRAVALRVAPVPLSKQVIGRSGEAPSYLGLRWHLPSFPPSSPLISPHFPSLFPIFTYGYNGRGRHDRLNHIYEIGTVHLGMSLMPPRCVQQLSLARGKK